MIETCALGSVVDVSAGQPAPRANQFGAEGKPFIRAGSLESLLNDGTLSDCEKVPDAAAGRKRLRLYPKDTIVFAKSGMSATMGRVYRLSEPAYVVSHLAALVPTGMYDPPYLAHWLRRNPPSYLIKDSAYPSIRVSEIEGIKVPAVPIQEQRRIAAILDKADGIRREGVQQLRMTDDLLTSLFQKMFLGPESDWPVMPLRDASELINGDRSKNYPSGKDLVSKGVLFLNTKNISGSHLIFDEEAFITKEKFRSLTRGQLKRGDLVFTLRGSIGQCAIFDSDDHETGFINAQLMIIRPNERVTSSYLHRLIIHPTTQHRLLRAKSGSAVPQLTSKQIGDLQVPVPPIELQHRFYTVVRKAGQSDRGMRMALSKAENLVSSLAQRAFSDEL